MNGLLLFAKQELLKHLRRPNEWLCVLLLYVIVASLLPIAIGAWPLANTWQVPSIVWSSILLVSITNQENLIRADFKLGVFDIIWHSDYSLRSILCIKILIHWLLYSLPLVCITPFIMLAYGLSMSNCLVITASLFLGSIFLSFMAAIGAGLTVALSRGGIFLAVLILPLYVPMLCLGTNVGMLNLEGISVSGHFAMIAALVILAVIFVPPTVAAAIKVNMD